jgi:putative transposon-encoded protein
MGEKMPAKEKGTAPKAVGGEPQDPGNSAKTEFRILGEEMIEKKVKTSGKTGRVYLPGNWVGRLVKIIRLD